MHSKWLQRIWHGRNIVCRQESCRDGQRREAVRGYAGRAKRGCKAVKTSSISAPVFETERRGVAIGKGRVRLLDSRRVQSFLMSIGHTEIVLLDMVEIVQRRQDSCSGEYPG